MNTLLLILLSIGYQEIIIIALIVLLLFGGKKIPELMRGMGKGVKSFKDGMKEVENEINNDSSTETPQNDKQEEAEKK